ncbi:MAG: GNAT family N-acetyltransferase [Proteobacteria bacterium]|nr:GNAT family N-acetyltransferase [Pseudomonadota bacterium]
MTAVAIRRDDLQGPAIVALLAEHLAQMQAESPPESVHALDLRALRQPEVQLFSAWAGDDLLGCGALKRLSATHAEIKSMRTTAAARRRGVARALLAHLVDTARAQGVQRLSLETGSEPAFAPARALYAQAGFVACEPFDGYGPDPNSVFMTRLL